ncbi:hypothetical protein [Flagellimonas pacifica]|uniref:Type II secretion system protein n=1 Tax=Flagellimonas pacifica TaxID=1247520 RepID=A0A285MRD2_9FLAO|nr:hypothetical protein [Allomuricauda parva]SNY99698.1 hypothetical protein SAMN06265377_1509 [Allomuricauda parva]
MAVLKRRIKASTLMETMVATVLIVIIFMLSSLILNNLFVAQVKGNLQPVKTHLDQVEYLYSNGKLTVPYYEEWNDWNISIQNQKDGTVLLEAKEQIYSESRTLKRIVDNVEIL